MSQLTCKPGTPTKLMQSSVNYINTTLNGIVCLGRASVSFTMITIRTVYKKYHRINSAEKCTYVHIKIVIQCKSYF